MEEEYIDLRVYIQVLVRWWREIVIIPVIVALLSAGLAIMFPPPYEATASVIVSKSKSNINLGSALNTLTEEDLAVANGRYYLDPTTRRNALANLVKNQALAEIILPQLDQTWFVGQENREPTTILLEKIAGTTETDSDLIFIHATDADPARAAHLATLWGEAYVRYINDLYTKNTEVYDVVDTQVKDAEAAYQKAQTALEKYLQENRVVELTWLIAEKHIIIERMQSNKQLVFTQFFTSEWKSDIQSSYIDIMLSQQALGGLEGYSSSLSERVKNLSRNYSLKYKYETQVRDVKAMQQQLQNGGDPATNALAIFLLKAQVFDTIGGLPGQLQLQIEKPAAQTREAQLADLEALVTTLSRYIKSLNSQIATEYAAIQKELAYGFDVIPVDDPQDATNARRNQLQAEVQKLKAELESEEALQRELSTARDLAWESYSTLLRRQAEVRIDRDLPESEVRFAASAAYPTVRKTSRLMIIAGSGVAAGMLIVLLAFVLDYMGQPPLFSRWATTPANNKKKSR